MKRLLAVLLLCGSAIAPLQAAVPNVDIYVAQNTQGGDTGADVADAHSLAWLNTPGNWGPGSNQVAPGTTVHLVGILTNTLVAYGSGTAGNPITIYFESNAMFSAPTLPANSIWINIKGSSWITIDGGVNGVVQLTGNGTVAANGGIMPYGNSGIHAISAALANNITIQNLTISNMFNRQTNTEPIIGADDGMGIVCEGGGVTVSNCTITGVQEAITLVFLSSPVFSNLTVVNCTLSNYNHAIVLGSGASNPLFDNVILTGNTLQSGDMFETGGGDLGLHRDGIFFFNSGDGTGCISNILISGNFIKHGLNPQTTTAGTGAMFFNFNEFNCAHVRIYNNVCTLAYPLAWMGGGGTYYCAVGGIGQDILVANNTFVSWTNGVGGYGGGGDLNIGGTNAFCYNNLICGGSEWITAWYYQGGMAVTWPNVALAMTGITSDYNIYNGSGFTALVLTNNTAIFYEDGGNNFNQWTNKFNPATGFNFDVHSTTNAVQLAANFAPLSTDTVANGNGTNLTAWGITNDYAGNARPANGNWTIGAYQIAAGTNNNSPNITNSGSGGPGGGSSGGGGSGSSGGTAPPAAGIASIVPGGGSDITNGLILQYKFNQTIGTTVTDSSGNGYTGSLTGAASWTNGLAGTQAILFSSNSDVNCSLNYSGDWTVSCWVYAISFPGTDDYAWSTTATTGLRIGPGVWDFYGDGASLQGTSPLNSNAWYFLAVSKSSGTNYQLYLNGAANASGVLANINMMFVEVGNNGYSQYMNGMVEDFRIYNRVLSPGEISTLAVNGPDDIALTMLSPPTNLRLIPAGP